MMFTNNDQFYPTPKSLVFKMLDKLSEEQYSLAGVRYILEPNCGKGDIVQAYKEYFNNKYKTRGWGSRDADKELKFDVIELDENLNSLLRGQNYNVVWDDFLTFDPPRFYDLIIMNPPFLEGDKNFLKAIQVQERVGGRVLCLLNAETLKNPYTNTRKHLIQLIQKYNGYVEYVDNAFSDAERKTDVETAFIYINVPMSNTETMFEKKFKRENPDICVDNLQSLMPNMNKLEKLVFEFNMVKNSSIELFKEKMRINKLLDGFGVKSTLNICDDKVHADKLTVNEYINKLTLSYWDKFIQETDFRNRLPSKLRDNFNYNIEKQQDIAFTIENVRYFYEQLIESIPESYQDTVSKVFDDLTCKYSYTDSAWNTSIHYYNGWATNNCYKIAKKSIIPCYHSNYFYRIPDTLKDLNIIFENISGVKDNIDRQEIVKAIEKSEKNIETEHFILNSYKKGTLHITYKNQEHLNQFNIMAGRSKNWLPPDFGKKKYSDMNDKEKNLVKEFGLNLQEYNSLTLTDNLNSLKLLN